MSSSPLPAPILSNMSLLKSRIESIRFFENLTFIPQLDICKHLNLCSLVLVSLTSKKWENIVEMRGMQTESVWEVTFSKNVLTIYLKFEDKTLRNVPRRGDSIIPSLDFQDTAQNFQVSFKEDPNASQGAYFEHDPCLNWITCFYKTSEQLEVSSLEALQLLSFLFPPTSYHRITVPLGPRSPDFPFRFLSKLPGAGAKYVDLQADQEVECGDLTKFLRAVGYSDDDRIMPDRNRLMMGMRIKNLVPCDQILIRNYDLKIGDARFLTNGSIQKLDFVYAEIGENNFTSKDFNAFFREWMTREKTKEYRPDRITFDIREDQNIVMEEVMQGLNAHVGKPRLRDRWRLVYKQEYDGHLSAKAIDCDKGWDIIDSHNILGTVVLEPNRLAFYCFYNRFHRAVFVHIMEHYVASDRELLEITRSHQKTLGEKITARGLKARVSHVNELAVSFEHMKLCKDHMEGCLEVLEKLKSWNND